MVAKTDQKQTAEPITETQETVAPVAAERVWLDMETREIVRECGDTVWRYMPGETEFDFYAEMNTFEKRNASKPIA